MIVLEEKFLKELKILLITSELISDVKEGEDFDVESWLTWRSEVNEEGICFSIVSGFSCKSDSLSRGFCCKSDLICFLRGFFIF